FTGLPRAPIRAARAFANPGSANTLAKRVLARVSLLRFLVSTGSLGRSEHSFGSRTFLLVRAQTSRKKKFTGSSRVRRRRFFGSCRPVGALVSIPLARTHEQRTGHSNLNQSRLPVVHTCGQSVEKFGRFPQDSGECA